MACTLSTEGESKLCADGVLPQPSMIPGNVVLVGCGGLTTQPKCAYDLEIEVYGFKFIVPTLVVPGQRDEFIIGSNVIKCVLKKMTAEKKYWDLISCQNSNPECEEFLELLSCVSRWSGPQQPAKLGTVRLCQAVTLLPRCEHLVWGKLPANTNVSPGSSVIVEPTTSRSAPRHVFVGRLVTPMWGDRWVPMKILNPTESPITLRRNTKLADVSPCLAVEDSWKEELASLIVSYNDVFSKDRLDCGKVRDFVHRIHLSDERPFRLPYRRTPPAHYQKLREVLSEMEEKGIISKSVSEYASPLVMAWKKDGSLRVCTDFRWLNAKTIKDAHPLPHQADCIAALGGNLLFSSVDLTSGFYNVPLHVSDRHYTAFTTPMGLYEYNRLPQGLCNSPASFMRMMLSVFGDLNFSSLLCYLDDLLVFARSEQEALKRLEVVFSRMRASNLKLAPKKCHFLRRSIKFLGHVISGSGVSVDEGKVAVISAFQKNDLMKEDGVTPSPKKLRSFLGMVLYYQSFIPGCTRIAKPLFDLTAGQKRLMKGTGSRKRSGTYRELSPQDWTPACDVAFEELKRALVESVVLAHPNFERPFILCTDASLDGLGAVLSQVPSGEDKARPIAFASKSLSRSQANYPAQIRILSSEVGMSQRLLSEPNSELLKSVHSVEDDSVQKTFRLTCQPQTVDSALNLSSEINFSMTTEDVSSVLSSCEDWDSEACQQNNDAVVSRVAFYVSRKRRPNRRERANEDLRVLRILRQWEKLFLLHGILYRAVKDPLTKHKKFQFVLPGSLKQQALSGVHDLAGHQGQPRTLSLARQRFYWPEMERDVRDYVKTCTRCVLSKTPEPAARAPLESIKTTAPLELVCIDFWSAEDKHNKSVDVLVITDHFTKLAHAFPCRNQCAKSVAKKLWDGFFCIYGFPQRIHSDQGANFESELIAELLDVAGVDKSRTSPYHPMGNGGTESLLWRWLKRTLLQNKNTSLISTIRESKDCMSVGDHVLVANKGCWGKRKLADKWEPTMYSVVASKPSLHIYKIRDRSGHEKVLFVMMIVLLLGFRPILLRLFLKHKMTYLLTMTL
ncbi:retrotransposable element [Pimephales promelas]|nr:retrotransposable element [Pimephales promelas]